MRGLWETIRGELEYIYKSGGGIWLVGLERRGLQFWMDEEADGWDLVMCKRWGDSDWLIYVGADCQVGLSDENLDGRVDLQYGGRHLLNLNFCFKTFIFRGVVLPLCHKIWKIVSGQFPLPNMKNWK